tara:strand:- start:796 stop:1296 length:501 start_codon:yes stop_codon:yes gene_type:complete
MATALFLTRSDLVKNTILDGNIDTDKFIQFVKIAQEIHVRNYLGTDLYNKLQSDIIAGTLSGTYLTLKNTYVVPMLIHWSNVEYLPFAAYSVKNGGVFKHISENAESVSKEEVDFLINKEREFAEYYTQRFIDFMVHNQQDYPEYNTNSNEDIHPDKDTTFQGWVL